jgi:hypothetical protein
MVGVEKVTIIKTVGSENGSRRQQIPYRREKW